MNKFKQLSKPAKILIISVIVLLVLAGAYGAKLDKEKEQKTTTASTQPETTQPTTEKTTTKKTETIAEQTSGLKTRDDLNAKISDVAKDTGLTIALGGNPEIWDIVEIHAQEPNDAMKKAFVALLTAIEPPYTNDKAGMLYESNIGKEYATDGNGNIKRVLFSAPNDIEKEYRIDIYTTAFKE